MKLYNISEAIVFLQEHYGSQMPTSEETLRRAIRTKSLTVQESQDPGKRGYTILESDLRDYAERRLNRIAQRKTKTKPLTQGRYVSSSRQEAQEDELVPFPVLYKKYLDKTLDADKYYLSLFSEKLKWEERMVRQKEALMRLDMERQRLENDIELSKSAIEAYEDGIKKCKL